MGKYLDSVGLSHLIGKIKTLVGNYLPLTGGTLTGNLTINTNSTDSITFGSLFANIGNSDLTLTEYISDSEYTSGQDVYPRSIGLSAVPRQDDTGSPYAEIGALDINGNFVSWVRANTNGAVDINADTTAITADGGILLDAPTGGVSIDGDLFSTAEIVDGGGNTLSAKQDTLVSGTNIKTINNESLLGSGNISVGGGSGSLTLDDVANNQFGGDTGDWAFVYDGEETNLVTFPRLWYGTCSTAASTAAKTSSITGFKLYKGALVALQMSNLHSNSSSNATLNVSSTGAKTIYANGKTVRVSGGTGSASYDYGWNAGDTVLFLYDGTYWRIVGIKGRRTSFSVACSGVASGNITVCKSGDCVTISFNGVTTGAISSRSVIATIPAGYRPPMEVYSTGNSGVASTNGSGIMIDTSGNVKVDPKVKNLTLYDHITYCAWS